MAARPSAPPASTQVCGTLFLSRNSRTSRQVRVAEVPEDSHADVARPLQHDPARLEGLEQLVAEVGDLLEDPAQVALADAVGPGLASGVGRDDGEAVGQQ